MKEVFSASFSSELSKMKDAVKLILGFIKCNNPHITAESIADLRLIYSELLSNAIIHGNECDPDKKVYVIIKCTGTGIVSKIMDEGKGFCHTEILKRENAFEDIFSESGRGLKLVNAMTDELTFMGGGNAVKFNKKLIFQIQLENEYDYISRVSNY